MITANRTHRHFNIDKYLDEQLAQGADHNGRIDRMERAMHPQHGGSSPANGKDFGSVPFSTADACWCQPFDGPEHPGCPMHGTRFRNWAVRLNDRCERLLDRVDWVRIDIWLGTLGGFALTGCAVYFLYVLADAWLQGRFNLGGN